MKLLDRVLALGNLVGLAEMAYIESDCDLNILTWNAGAIQLFGYSEHDAMETTMDKLVPISKHELIECNCPKKITTNINNDSGEKVWYDFFISPIVSLKGHRLGVSVLVKDISQDIKKNTDLIEYRNQLQQIYEFAPIGIFKADMKGNFTLANSEFAWMLGYDSTRILIKKGKRNFFDIFTDKEKREEFKDYLKESEEVNKFRCQLTKSNGTSLWTLSFAKLVHDGNGQASFNGFAIDITDTIRAENGLKEANKKLSLLSVQDGLTKIPNRRKFDDFLSMEWARHFRDKNELAIIICDIDFFKYYNDTYGHQQGDDCLIKVASAIKNSVFRPGDLAARYGGEEFSVVLPQTNGQGALKVAENINKAVEQLKIIHKSSSVNEYVTLSVGASSVIPTGEISFEDLLAKADEALYEAKETGRNKAIYKPF